MANILIASAKTLEGHRAAITDVLQLLLDHDLYLNPEKCVWKAPCVNYLRLILEKGVTHMDPTKIKGIKTWPVPTSVKEVHFFMGSCNFYHSFIYKFAHIAKPLNSLTKKDAPWEWTSQHQQAFNTLQSWVTSKLILIQPQLHNQFDLEVDVLGFALGAVLSNRTKLKKQHPVAYYSSTLSEAECNYDIYDLELHAIVKALRNWWHYLAGSLHKIIVYTNHANLQYWQQPHKTSRRVAREVLELLEFNVELCHLAGTTDGQADAPSRHPDYDQGDENNKDEVVFPDHLFIRATVGVITNPQKVKTSTYSSHGSAHTTSMKMQENGTRMNARWLLKEWKSGTTLYKMIMISLWLDTLGLPTLSNCYNSSIGGQTCQWNKVNTQVHKAPLSPIYSIKEVMPFQTIALDFTVKLPKSKGHDFILTITDHDCTKMMIFIPCQETVSAESVALLFLGHVLSRPLPWWVLHGQGYALH